VTEPLPFLGVTADKRLVQSDETRCDVQCCFRVIAALAPAPTQSAALP
jgi:hypothetical protein